MLQQPISKTAQTNQKYMRQYLKCVESNQVLTSKSLIDEDILQLHSKPLVLLLRARKPENATWQRFDPA